MDFSDEAIPACNGRETAELWPKSKTVDIRLPYSNENNFF